MAGRSNAQCRYRILAVLNEPRIRWARANAARRAEDLAWLGIAGAAVPHAHKRTARRVQGAGSRLQHDGDDGTGMRDQGHRSGGLGQVPHADGAIGGAGVQRGAVDLDGQHRVAVSLDDVRTLQYRLGAELCGGTTFFC